MIVLPLLRDSGPSSSFDFDLSFLRGKVPISEGAGERTGGREAVKEGGGGGGRGGGGCEEDGIGSSTEQATR